ncbi:MAG: peptidase C11 [Ruminococcus sp.]|nr:peptidase C11 [Ruminococcus sp.]
MEHKRPRSREKNVTSGGKGVHRRGSGLGSGPVGSKSPSSGGSGRSTAKRAAIGGGIGLPTIVVIGLVIFNMLKSGGASNDSLQSVLPNNSSSGNYAAMDASPVDTSVAAGSRAKYTQIKGGKNDTVTIMVYICGTDLESKNGMASSDIQEMASASFGDNVNLILYTGGCKEWKINGISNKVHQIYQIKNGELIRLEDDYGSGSMTDPKTLTSFIRYCNKNFPANRNQLIFWDHGGGSVSGFGYDEKKAGSGSMDLAEIDSALTNAGVRFDFVGFDACLMATAETALMLNEHADYMIASEETEPGIGWYYTDWLTELGRNTSLPTVEIGKNIIDDFVDTCAKKCRGQKTTLSIIDLAEFSNTVPSKLSSFAQSVSTKLSNEEYKQVSDARYTTREFASSSKIDQVDLAHLALNMDNSEGKALSDAIQNAVKYNRTSSNMSNAYGVSIYFPYRKTSNVDTACNTYSQIGMDSEYSKCIKQFASLETTGQVASGGTSSPLPSLMGMLGGSGSSGSSDVIGQLLSSFLSGSSDRTIEGLDDSNTEYMNETALSAEDSAEYVSMNYFDTSNLVWEKNSSGQYIMSLPEKQWELVHNLDKNLFYDDGEGYVDMGLDNVFEFDDEGNLIADTDNTWVAINGQPVAYYHTDTTEFDNDTYSISGYVPAMLNDERVNLILTFDSENPNGYIAGATTDYVNNETDTVAKSMIELETGDTLDFICDYYTYDGSYSDSYFLGEQMTVTDNMEISNVSVGDGELKISYCFTDIYNQEYWSETIIP